MRFAVSTTLMAGMLFGVAAMPAAAQRASLPFPTGTKYAYLDLQRILAQSVHGQTANARVQQLTEQKRSEIEARQATLQTQIDAKNQNLLQLQQRLAQGETVMSAEARLSLSREIGRLQREIQRDTEDAQAEMQRVTQDADAELTELTQQLQVEFDARLSPAVDYVARQMGVDLIFNVAQGTLAWAKPELDLTQAVVDRLNASQ